jgi:hypothetical protein
VEKIFKREHAEEILKHCGRLGLTINERGVWPEGEYDLTMPTDSELGFWRPAQVFQDEPEALDTADTAMLPFPFSAPELAAFMLEGAGALVQDHYGRCGWDTGPDPVRLNDIPSHQNFARRAVKEAFDACREAARAVVPRPLALYAEAELAREAWKLANNEANEREGVFAAMPGIEEAVARLERNVRRTRAVASIAALDEAMKKTADDYNDAAEVWLKAMVRQLLLPAPELAPATPGAVVASGDRPAPLAAAPAWSPITVLMRAPGYRWPLYQLLKEAHINGRPCPKAREVLEIWKLNTPPELEVMTDGVKYSDAVGNTKEADLKAIQQAIKGLLKK